ncbi:uncharacterized protein FFB14_15294 [Fusarium fujikuroi]|nr:uncharacterized protein FFB14_15294 [Fusarium fujikuroi]
MSDCATKSIIPSYGYTTAWFYVQCYCTSQREACCDKNDRILAKTTEPSPYQAQTNDVALCLKYSIRFSRFEVGLVNVDLRISLWKPFKPDGAADGALLNC